MKTSLVLIYQIEFQKIELFQKKETDFFLQRYNNIYNILIINYLYLFICCNLVVIPL